MRLGWQTTGDGLVYRGAIGDTATLDPSGLNNAWMLLDTANGNLYAYRAKAWRLVSGGGGGVTMPFDSVTFNVNETDASLRELKYSEEKGYLQYGGQDSVQIPLLPGIWYVRNDTSVTIPKGTVVRATGTLGASGRIKVKHMIANGSIDAMYILGIAMQDIAVGADGYVMTQGKIRQVNTQAYSEGAVLYADVDTLGGLTQTEPTGSNLKLPIAFVVHSASNGTLAVRVSPGTYLRDLHDVYITSPDSSASLYYNKSESVWRDTTAAVLTSDTSVFARDFQISGTTNRLAMFTGSNTVGNAPMSVGGDTLNIITNAGFSTFRYNRDFSISSNTFAGWPVGTRFYSLLNSTSSASVSFGDGTNGTVQNQAFMQLTSWTGGGANYYSSRLINNNTGDLGFYLSSLGSNANPTMSATPHLMILNGGNVGIATSSPSRPLHVAGTTAIRIPVGTTSDRGTSANGDIRYNTTNANFEWYSGTGWREPVNAARSPAAGLANRFSKFDANGLLDTSAILIQANNRIGIFNSPAAGDSALTVTGGIRATSDMYARRYNVSTFTGQVLSINNYAPTGSNGRNIFIGNGGASLSGTLTSASENIGIGIGALFANTTGSQNTAIGYNALNLNTTGYSNFALGSLSLNNNTNGYANTALGNQALQFNNSGHSNLAVGYAALNQNTTGVYNVAIGLAALLSNINGIDNTAICGNALYSNISGTSNTAIGRNALEKNTTGSYNIAISQEALYKNLSGSFNTVIGFFSLRDMSSGFNNIGIGAYAGRLTSSGADNSTCDNSVFLGYDARPSGSSQTNQVVIGYQAIGNGSNTTTIGNSSTTKTFFQYGETYIGTATDNGAYNLQVAGGSYLSGEIKYVNRPAAAAVTNVGVDANGVLREATSSQRFKDNITPYQKGLSDAMRLQAKTYTYKGDTMLQAGFIAEDVHEAGLTEYVNYDKEGRPYSLQYGNMVTLLLNAMKEQQAQIEALKKEIEALKNK